MILADKSLCRDTGAGLVERPEGAEWECLVVGLGNCLLGDDGIGVHAVWQLSNQLPPGAFAIEVGTDVFSALTWIERVPRVLAIDALDAGGPPGTIYRGAPRDVKVRAMRTSLHELDFLAALEFVPPAKWPAISILGVQPALIHYGLDLSPALQAALPKVVEAARATVASWLEVRRRPSNRASDPLPNSGYQGI